MTVPARFPRLLDQHRERVYRAAYRILRDEGDALDTVQETFLRLLSRLDGIRDELAGAWLARVATHLAVDRVRRRDPVREARPLVTEPTVREEEVPLVTAETREALSRALENLSPRQREVVTLRVIEDLSFVELSRGLGISEGAAKVHFRRGMEALRRSLGPAGSNRGGVDAG